MNSKIVLPIKLIAITLLTLVLLTTSSTSPFVLVKAQLPLPPDVKREEVLVLDLVTGRPTTPTNFNLWRAGVPSANRVQGMQNLCLAPLWYTDVVTGSIINGIAGAMPESNSDFTLWKFKVRQGIYWSDGTEVTAEDVAYTLKQCLTDSGLGCYAWANTWIKDARTEDRYTVIIELKKSNPHFWASFLGQTFAPSVFVMPKHVFEKTGINASQFEFNPPVCNGIYELQSFDSMGYWYLWKLRDDWKRSVIYYVYKEYFGIELQYPGPKYVMFIDFGTPENKVYAMARGDLDMIMELTPEAFETLISMCETCRGFIKEYPYAWMHEPESRFLRLNIEKFPFNRSEVRLALALMTNMTEVAITAYKGIVHLSPLGIVAGPIEQTYYFKAGLYNWLLNYEITLPNGNKFKIFDPEVPTKIARWAVSQGYLKEMPSKDYITWIWGVGWWKYAPEVAEQLLKSVGMSKGADGKWRLPDGSLWKIEITTTTYEVDVYRLAFALADQWRKLGIEVTVTALEAATFTDQRNRRTYEDILTDWGGPRLAILLPELAPTYFESFHSRYYKPRGEYSPNVLGLKDPYLDQLIDEAMGTPAWDPKIIELGKNIVKYVYVEQMYAIGTIMIKKFTPRSERYWTNFPSAENPYWIPYFWGVNFQLALPMIVQKGAPQPTLPRPTETRTPTPTTTPTPTHTTTPVTTPTETGATTITITTISVVERTTTVLSTSRLTTTVRETDWSMTMLLTVVLFVVGFAIGWFMKKK